MLSVRNLMRNPVQMAAYAPWDGNRELPFGEAGEICASGLKRCSS